MPCSRLMMMIHMGILNRAGSQFYDDEPRLELTLLPTLHWLCLHITLQPLQRRREGLTFKYYCNSSRRATKTNTKGCSKNAVISLVTCVHLCLKCPLLPASSVKTNRGRGVASTEWPSKRRGKGKIGRWWSDEKDGWMEWDRAEVTSAKRLADDWREIVREGYRGIKHEPTVAAVWKPLKVNFSSSASCQYPCDQNLCRPTICFPFTLCRCTPLSWLPSSGTGHASGHYQELISEYGCVCGVGWHASLYKKKKFPTYYLDNEKIFLGLLLKMHH